MKQLFFIGAGKMATAIATGLTRTKTFSAEELSAYDVDPDAAAKFTDKTGIRCRCGEIVEEELDSVPAILLAVKPQHLSDALNGLKSILETKLVISIAAGISLARLYDLTDSARIVRVMPNTPALIGRGCAVAALTAEVTVAERELVRKIFSSVGSFAELEEKQIDAVTGLAGSGPAYVFEFIRALADGGVAEGLPRDLAMDLAARTVAGAADMVTQTGQHPAILCDQVNSPGGTTSRGLEQLSKGGFHAAVVSAVRAAAIRSAELGQM